MIWYVVYLVIGELGCARGSWSFLNCKGKKKLICSELRSTRRREREREGEGRTRTPTRTVSLTHESKTVMANENVHESRKKLMDQTELSTCICDLCIYLSMLGFHQSLHLQRGKLSVRLKSAAIPPQLKRVKKELKREMVKKDSGKRCPSLFTSLSTHLWSFFFKKLIFYYMKFWVGGKFWEQWSEHTCLGALFFSFQKQVPVKWIDQNRGTSFDLTLSFQIIWCTSQAPFDEQQRTFEERERERESSFVLRNL